VPPHQNPAPNKLYYGDNLAVLRDYPRLQVLTIKELLEGTKSVQRPLHVRDVTFKKAPRSRSPQAENLTLNLTPED
jgi:hypothetical protein